MVKQFKAFHFLLAMVFMEFPFSRSILFSNKFRFLAKNCYSVLKVSCLALLGLYSKYIVNSECHTTDSVRYGRRSSNLPFPLYHQ